MSINTDTVRLGSFGWTLPADTLVECIRVEWKPIGLKSAHESGEVSKVPRFISAQLNYEMNNSMFSSKRKRTYLIRCCENK